MRLTSKFGFDNAKVVVELRNRKSPILFAEIGKNAVLHFDR
jgi:hypothetical protein